MIDESERDRIETMRKARYECFIDESAGMADEDENPFAFDRSEDDPDTWDGADGPE